MNPIVKNILAVIAGWLGGSAINLSLIQAGHKLLPIEGIDANDMTAMAAIWPTLEFEYFIFPFLAHTLGTLAGAVIAGLIAASHKMKFSLGIGGFFLIGGIMVNYMLQGPTWFTVIDITLAYIPMAWLGGKMALHLSRNKNV